MFSRRTDPRFNRGRIATVMGAPPTPPPVTPLTIFGQTGLYYWESDGGITLNGSNVSDWLDKSNAVNMLQGTAAAQPLYVASGGPAGAAYVSADGVDDFLIAPALAGTDPALIWVVGRQPTWVANTDIVSGTAGNTSIALRKLSASPRISMMSMTAANAVTTLALNAWGRLVAEFTNSVSDFAQHDGNVPVTGASAGSVASAGRRMFTNRNSSAFTTWDMVAHGIFFGSATVQQKTDLQTYLSTKYPTP